ncbi:hypothetical protein ACHAW6_006060 [Cyclotella cf. meneghiniana]
MLAQIGQNQLIFLQLDQKLMQSNSTCIRYVTTLDQLKKECIGEEFQELLLSYDITPKPTTIKNPTAQVLVEQLHLTLGNHLCMSIY